jgi:hypothetical protein
MMAKKMSLVDEKVWWFRDRSELYGDCLSYSHLLKHVDSAFCRFLPSALKVPYKTRFAEVTASRKDLEIGEIESQQYRNGSYDSPE